MADRVLFVSWGAPVRGREEQGLEVFNDAVGFYGHLQQEGRIESFDVTLLEPNGDVYGYMQLHGSAEQLAAVRELDEFRDLTTMASLMVEELRIVMGATGAGVAAEVERYQGALTRVPQMR